MVDVRKGMPSVQLSEDEFKARFLSRFFDPAFDAVQAELARGATEVADKKDRLAAAFKN